jgi:predicted enzyme related to lactoylglutathione lyase
VRQPNCDNVDRPRERVTGIGGVFFRASDPDTLRAWYAEHLGIEIDPSYGGASFPWSEGGSTVWCPFSEDATYFGPPDQRWMVNYRVCDLDAMLGQLRAAGADVAEEVEESEFGRFGWAYDPEGHRFELWEPPAGSTDGASPHPQ